MKRHRIAVAFLLAGLMAVSGCGGVKFPKYYALNLPRVPDPPAQAGRPSIAVRQIQAPAYLRQGAIVYRSTPEEIGFYDYHRWAEDPRLTVTSAVVEDLRASGEFSNVWDYDGRHDAEYVFSGKLQKLEEVDYEGGVKVEVAIEAQITKAKSGAAVWSNAVTEARSVSKHTVPGVVAQMNTTTDVAITKLLATIPAALTDEK